MGRSSAKGLFRATGHKPKPVTVQLLDGTFETLANGLARERHEFYPTPPEPTLALAIAEKHRLDQFRLIWEPAAGKGDIANVLRALGHLVFVSDIVDRGIGAEIRDFYAYKDPADVPRAIVTNPPYDQCNWRDGKARWMRHALDELQVDYMALLLSWNWPGAAGLKSFWRTNPPARIYIMRWKIDFTGQGAPPMLNAWFVWDKQREAVDTVFRVLDRVTPAQLDLEL